MVVNLILYIILLIFISIIYYIKRKKFVYYLPFIFFYLELVSVLQEEIGVVFSTNGFYLTALIATYIFNLNINRYISKNILTLSIILITFSIVLFINLSPELDLINRASRYLNFVLALGLIPLSFSNSDRINIKEVIYLLYLLSILYTVYVISSSIFKYGPNHYDTGIIYGLMYEQWYLGALLISLSPVIIKERGYKIIDIILFVTLIILILLVLRRTVWAIIILSFIFYMLMDGGLKQKVKVFFVGTVLLVPIFYVINETGVWKYRGNKASISTDNLEEESRFLEYINTYYILKSNDRILQGTGHLFNERGKYGHPNKDRAMHGTIARIFFGAGLIGIILYYTYKIYVLLLLMSKSRTSNYSMFTKFTISNYMVYFLVAFTGASGIGLGISYVGTLFILIGFNLKLNNEVSSCYSLTKRS